MSENSQSNGFKNMKPDPRFNNRPLPNGNAGAQPNPAWPSQNNRFIPENMKRDRLDPCDFAKPGK
jgi:hypothetical protein